MKLRIKWPPGVKKELPKELKVVKVSKCPKNKWQGIRKELTCSLLPKGTIMKLADPNCPNEMVLRNCVVR